MDPQHSMHVDTGCLYDNRILGGRVGLYSFSQEDVHFMNLHYQSLSSNARAELQAQCDAEKTDSNNV